MRETVIHKAVANYLNNCLALPAFWTTFPAGGGGVVRGKHLKALGLKAGFPDILIIHGGKPYGIELKAPKKYPEPEQRALHGMLADAGCQVMVCRSAVEVEMTLRHWGIPLSGRIAA
jgi:hypothetical protein